MMPRGTSGLIGAGTGGGAARRAAAPRVALLRGARHLRADLRHAGAQPAAAGGLHGARQPGPRGVLRACRLHRLSRHAGKPGPVDLRHAAAGGGGRRARGARRRRPVAAHAGLLLSHGDARLRADAVLPVPRHQARRRHRRRVPGPARARRSSTGSCRSPGASAPTPSITCRWSCWLPCIWAWCSSCARCSGACSRASASTSTACRRWASTRTATSSPPSPLPACWRAWRATCGPCTGAS